MDTIDLESWSAKTRRTATSLKDGEGNYIPFDEAIGNGSVVTARVTVFTTTNGRTGCRLEGLCVDEHVPYEGVKVEEELPF